VKQLHDGRKARCGNDLMNMKRVVTLLLHAFAGWLLCAATMGIGMALTTQDIALVVHAIAAPVFFGALSLFYFSRFNYTKPLATATVFVSFVMIVDFLIVGLLVNRSLSMFTSLLGTWIPFALIFASTLIVGLAIQNRRRTATAK
jgi:hypothetical protein